MKLKIKINRNFKQERLSGKQTSRYRWKWFKTGHPTPINQGGTDSVVKLIKAVFNGWVYTFKYPTTVSKTFWQVLRAKISI